MSCLRLAVGRLSRGYWALCAAVLGAWLAAPFSWSAAAQPSAKSETRALTLGMVSEVDQAEIQSHFRDFVGYVVKRLYPETAASANVLVAATPFELAKLLEQRRVDFYLESVYPTYTINYVHNAGRTILRRHKGGLADYQSLIFTKRGGPIKRLEDLRGKTLAFEDAASTSAYLLPKLFLQKQGFKLVEKRGYDPNSSAGMITYVFALAQDRLVDLVRRQEVQAGAFSDDDYASLSEAVKGDLTVLAQTERLPRHLASVRADLDGKSAARIEEILLAMSDDASGRRILEKIDRTTKFDPLPGGEAALKRRLLDTFFTPGAK